jgi:hypothetical protein
MCRCLVGIRSLSRLSWRRLSNPLLSPRLRDTCLARRRSPTRSVGHVQQRQSRFVRVPCLGLLHCEPPAARRPLDADADADADAVMCFGFISTPPPPAT